jgi:hypothetical protein
MAKILAIDLGTTYFKFALLSSALFLTDGQTPLLWVANDVAGVSKESTQRVRVRISARDRHPARQRHDHRYTHPFRAADGRHAQQRGR